MIQSFNGKTPRIASSAYIAESASVIGDVEIGENCGVWHGTVIRADFASIKIGDNTFIEENCVLHTASPMEIGNNVIIGHGAIFHGKSIKEYTLIGSNANVLDDAEIGSFCIIGAGSLVKKGTIIPDGVMVAGVPAQVKGKTREEQHLFQTESIERYRNLARQYREESR